MKNSIYFLSVLFFVACGSPSEESTEENWYSGGTLHKSDIATWRNASSKNKLATCADYVANIKEYENLEMMKKDAEELMTCIDEAAIGSEVPGTQSTSEIAASCILLTGIGN